MLSLWSLKLCNSPGVAHHVLQQHKKILPQQYLHLVQFLLFRDIEFEEKSHLWQLPKDGIVTLGVTFRYSHKVMGSIHNLTNIHSLRLP